MVSLIERSHILNVDDLERLTMQRNEMSERRREMLLLALKTKVLLASRQHTALLLEFTTFIRQRVILGLYMLN